MTGPPRRRLTYANVVSTLCLFAVLGGSSYAAVTLKRNSVRSTHIRDGQVKRADLGASAVDSSKVRDGSLLAGDFAAGQLPAGPRGEPGPPGEPGPLVSTLPSGRTLTGAWAFGAHGAATAVGDLSYPFPLATSPTPHVIQPGDTPPAECPGTVSAPAAQGGHLCIYVSFTNASGDVKAYSVEDGSGVGSYRRGAAVYQEASGGPEDLEAAGTWAVTAP